MSLVDLDVFKPYVNATRVLDFDDDGLLQSALDAAGVGINQTLGRTIAVADTVATTRSYAPIDARELFIADCSTVTGVTSIDTGNEWWSGSGWSEWDWTSPTAVATVLTETTDYQLGPINNRDSSGVYQPYSSIRRRGGWRDSGGWATVAVTATWGWATIPAPIIEACKILAKDILANRDVSFGIAAFTDYGGIRARSNPQVWQLIQPFSLHLGFG